MTRFQAESHLIFELPQAAQVAVAPTVGVPAMNSTFQATNQSSIYAQQPATNPNASAAWVQSSLATFIASSHTSLRQLESTHTKRTLSTHTKHTEPEQHSI